MLLTGDSLRGGKCVAAPLISLWSPAHPVTQRGELGRRVLSAPPDTLRRRPPGTAGEPAPQPTGDTVTTSLTAEIALIVDEPAELVFSVAAAAGPEIIDERLECTHDAMPLTRSWPFR